MADKPVISSDSSVGHMALCTWPTLAARLIERSATEGEHDPPQCRNLCAYDARVDSITAAPARFRGAV